MSSITPSRGRQLDQNAVPTTSLADMMFLLLIFFIMTTTLSRTTGFVTDVASGAKGESKAAGKTPTVAVHDGKLAVDDKAMTLQELGRYLRDQHLDQKTADGKVVIVDTAGAVTYQQYYEVMALIRNSGGVAAIVSEDTGAKKRNRCPNANCRSSPPPTWWTSRFC